VIVSKYCDHLPLYRQSQIYARAGLELDRATMAEWVGLLAKLIEPPLKALGDYVMGADKLHADDTSIPVLAPGTGKTKTGRLWTYVRDDQPSGSTDPPAVLFRYSPDRTGERPREHLKHFRGVLQADGYAGFQGLYDRQHEPPRLKHLREWLETTLRKSSKKSELAGAIRYTLSRWTVLTRYCEDGRIEIDNSAAERAQRTAALGRKTISSPARTPAANAWDQTAADLTGNCEISDR
jgi:transposase